jgi:signal transduction protein with GAF and PtsI domain
MPCYDGRTDQDYENEKLKDALKELGNDLNDVTMMLCLSLAAIQEKVPQLYEELVCATPKMYNWHNEHKKLDEKRKAEAEAVLHEIKKTEETLKRLKAVYDRKK